MDVCLEGCNGVNIVIPTLKELPAADHDPWITIVAGGATCLCF